MYADAMGSISEFDPGGLTWCEEGGEGGLFEDREFGAGVAGEEDVGDRDPVGATRSAQVVELDFLLGGVASLFGVAKAEEFGESFEAGLSSGGEQGDSQLGALGLVEEEQFAAKQRTRGVGAVLEWAFGDPACLRSCSESATGWGAWSRTSWRRRASSAGP